MGLFSRALGKKNLFTGLLDMGAGALTGGLTEAVDAGLGFLTSTGYLGGDNDQERPGKSVSIPTENNSSRKQTNNNSFSADGNDAPAAPATPKAATPATPKKSGVIAGFETAKTPKRPRVDLAGRPQSPRKPADGGGQKIKDATYEDKIEGNGNTLESNDKSLAGRSSYSESAADNQSQSAATGSLYRSQINQQQTFNGDAPFGSEGVITEKDPTAPPDIPPVQKITPPPTNIDKFGEPMPSKMETDTVDASSGGSWMAPALGAAGALLSLTQKNNQFNEEKVYSDKLEAMKRSNPNLWKDASVDPRYGNTFLNLQRATQGGMMQAVRAMMQTNAAQAASGQGQALSGTSASALAATLPAWAQATNANYRAGNEQFDFANQFFADNSFKRTNTDREDFFVDRNQGELAGQQSFFAGGKGQSVLGTGLGMYGAGMEYAARQKAIDDYRKNLPGNQTVKMTPGKSGSINAGSELDLSMPAVQKALNTPIVLGQKPPGMGPVVYDQHPSLQTPTDEPTDAWSLQTQTAKKKKRSLFDPAFTP